MPDLLCQDCGSTDVRTHLADAALCDHCFDRRVSEYTGFPRLPDSPTPRLPDSPTPRLPEPPPPVHLTDPDGRNRILRFRLWRAPTGVELELEETGVPPGEGYHRAVLGSHDADVALLVARLRDLAEADIACRFLEPNRHRPGWVAADHVVEGRLEWCDDPSSEVSVPYDAVIDGRMLNLEELGRALEVYEGWRFRLLLADRVDDLRPDAVVMSFPGAEPQHRG